MLGNATAISDLDLGWSLCVPEFSVRLAVSVIIQPIPPFTLVLFSMIVRTCNNSFARAMPFFSELVSTPRRPTTTHCIYYD